jgi:hypothetical protein
LLFPIFGCSNDVATNTIGAACIAIAVTVTSLWFLDPLGAILIAGWIIFNWVCSSYAFDFYHCHVISSQTWLFVCWDGMCCAGPNWSRTHSLPCWCNRSSRFAARTDFHWLVSTFNWLLVFSFIFFHQNASFCAAFNHSDQIKEIDTVRAYHFGSNFLVELDVVLPENMPLRQAHDIGETLQIRLEKLDHVERAFVHLDYESTHKPEHK